MTVLKSFVCVVRLWLLPAVLLPVSLCCFVAVASSQDRVPENKALWQAPATRLNLLPLEVADSFRFWPQSRVASPAQVADGGKSCDRQIEELSNLLTAGSQSGVVQIIPSAHQSGQAIRSMSMEVQLPEDILSYVSLSSAAVGEGRCGAVYEAVTYWRDDCQAVAQNGFAGLQSAGVVQRHILLLQGEGGLRVFLLPAGKGCVSIKKEVLE